jgi:hypothetical protein
MEILREAPTAVADERELLITWLDFERATLAKKCEGLDSIATARRAVPPSALSLLGLVRHLTDVETRWFADRFAGEQVDLLYRTADDADAAFNGAAGADLKEALDAWRDACATSRRVVAATESLGQLSAGLRGDGDHFSLRWLLMHMTVEYARHNGHADLLREAIDGVVGM